MRLLKPPRQCRNQTLFDVRRSMRKRECPLNMVKTYARRPLHLDRAMLSPGQVVVGAGSIGDAPERHGAIGISCEGSLETFDTLVVLEAVTPVQIPISNQRCASADCVVTARR